MRTVLFDSGGPGSILPLLSGCSASEWEPLGFDKQRTQIILVVYWLADLPSPSWAVL